VEQPEPAAEFEELVMSDGKVKAVLRRRGASDAGFLDWVNATWSSESWKQWAMGVPLDDDDVVLLCSVKLEQVFGFGVTTKRDRGLNFYKESWVLGDGYGYLCIGGQRGTVLVMVNGEGLAAARAGWEQRLHTFLAAGCDGGKLTRVDVARDFFDGSYSVDTAAADFDAGLFRLPKSPSDPDCEQRGNWRKWNGKGRTFCVGQRASGKYARIYEKGKQLGSPASNWVRVEVEFKSVDRVIPFDILLSPGMYLAGAYPAFEGFGVCASRMTTIRETKVVSKEKKEAWVSRQCGKDLFALVELEEGETPEARALNLINRLQVEELPNWAKVPDWRYAGEPAHVLHETKFGLRVTGRHAGTGTMSAAY
jgi:phage replication initiation protein